MKLHKYSRFKFRLSLGAGALVAAVLCVQSVRTYLYADAVLVPRQAEREAERQVGALTTAARSAGIADPHALVPVIEHALESAGDRVIWIRVLTAEGQILAQGGNPEGTVNTPAQWWERVEKHESLGRVAATARGKAFIALIPFRLPRPPHPPERPALSGPPPGAHRPPGFVVELAIPLAAVAGAFEGLRQNLIVGVIASMALLLSLAVIALRAPHYLRGRYLESELQLARRVQNDLQPKPQLSSAHFEFGAAALAADHVGGDFYDIFETESGKIVMVLGDVSGKGVPAALLVNVLQGAIRSSMVSQHEKACERINRMLCERTACERFATLFWSVFDPATSTLRYVNCGHAAPMLVRGGSQKQVERLDGGGLVLGLVPTAAYSARTVKIEAGDTVILYSDGINEAANQNDEEFGEDRICDLIRNIANIKPSVVCQQIMEKVAAFAGTAVPADDRTLLVVRFPHAESGNDHLTSEETPVEVFA